MVIMKHQALLTMLSLGVTLNMDKMQTGEFKQLIQTTINQFKQLNKNKYCAFLLISVTILIHS